MNKQEIINGMPWNEQRNETLSLTTHSTRDMGVPTGRTQREHGVKVTEL